MLNNVDDGSISFTNISEVNEEDNIRLIERFVAIKTRLEDLKLLLIGRSAEDNKRKMQT